MEKNKGFTLIELLVVIAIIGILASVVLASLNTARAKGADALIKSDLANMRAQAELVYSNSNSYDTVCDDLNVKKALNSAAGATGATWTSTSSNIDGLTCTHSAGAWMIAAPLKSLNVVNTSSATDYWCVDNTGISKVEVDAPLAAATTCL